jgi:hypothetical protein
MIYAPSGGKGDFSNEPTDEREDTTAVVASNAAVATEDALLMYLDADGE